MTRKSPFDHQLKTFVSIEQKINELIVKYRSLKGGAINVFFRVIVEPNSATLYKEGHQGRGILHSGVREADYKFSTSDPFWIEPSDTHGLSFSSTFNQTKFTIDLLGRFQKNKTQINTAYWILEDSQWIPKGMAFRQDPRNPEHYLLAVTERMKLTTLVNNLQMISHRMTVMKGLTLEVRKDA